MNNHRRTVDIVIPAYNEEHRIRATLEHYGAAIPENTRLIVSLNGCTDDTAAVVQDCIRTIQTKGEISMLEEPAAIGKGGAILRAWNESTADYIGFVDADASTSWEEFEQLIQTLDNHPEHHGIIASRHLPESTIADSLSGLRRLSSKLFSIYIRLLFGMPFTDTQCGAKLFRTTDAKTAVHAITTTNMAFDVDLLWQCKQAGLSIYEKPTYWVDKAGSSSLGSPLGFLRTGMTMAIQLARLRLRG